MKALKNSTALVVALGLMTPHYGLAQGTAANLEADIAAKEDALACITKGIADGMTEEDATADCQTNGGAAQGESAGYVAEDPTTAAAAGAETEASPDASADSAAQATAETPQMPEAPAVEGAAEVQPETVAPDVAAEAPTMSEADAQAAAEAAIAAQEPAQTEATEDAPAEATTETNETVAPEITVEAPPAEALQATPVEEPAQDTAKAPAPEAPQEPVTNIAEDTSAQTSTAPEPEMSPEAEAAAQMLEQALEAEASDGAPLAAAALAATTQDDAAAPMVEETVTEETARSSSEDFSNSVSGKAKASDDEQKGLTNLEKAALAGLAALAVGAVLKNGSEVAVNSGDRVVLQDPDGSYRVIKDDGALLRQPGTTVRTQNFSDGSSRTVSTRPDGAEIVTIYDSQKRIIKRTRIEPNGDEYVLVDDSRGAAPVEVTELPQVNVTETVTATDRDALAAALARQAETSRSFTLSQVRQIAPVRALAPAVTVDNVTFASGSAAIRPEQAEELALLGTAIRERIAQNPREVFLVEGHTDAVGSGAFNLALSDRRAESLALALTEYFDVPSENLVIQGYGEEYLKIATDGPEEENRRATVRRITDLLRTATAE
ncbi:OmpA family protein [Donghicola tyrosinivorans]|uniref:Outer membrane protein OmpA-like peptidoglycan-associated protein n=1 Tax=Donghicola tyrosinivorans TaxID=1652492 RepID=A0A2T0WH94_9RHOB|nr:OmpA family protein [Donghicola tyrosinivorans]PRY86071.1 outer membrane protein OmpA-like peptidoglycan-associated protein [Donghicola tyrosinivorans]